MIPPTLRRGHDQDQPTSVYVLTCESRVKIGIAANVARRVADLQLACPLPITIAHQRAFPTRAAARSVERSLHSRFGDKRIHGEWFVIDAAEVIAALTNAPEVAEAVVILGRLSKHIVVTEPEIVATPRPTPPLRRDGPTWDEYEAMDDDMWSEFMAPCAAVLDFENPKARARADELEASLRAKYPQYFDRQPDCSRLG